MIVHSFGQFKSIWVIDFEFVSNPGETAVPVCLVCKEVITGKLKRIWLGSGTPQPCPPFLNSADTLIVAYYSSAEMGCYLSLGWEPPDNLLDLFVEFRNITNGRLTIAGNSLLGALSHYGFAGIAPVEKESMRNLILSGGPWSPDEKEAILDYCQTDVEATIKLFSAMEKAIDLPRALIRSKYMKAVSRMEYNGVPIDTLTLGKLKQNWPEIQKRLVEEVDKNYGVYKGLTFNMKLFEDYLRGNNISWPRLESGALNLQDETFKEMTKKYPELGLLRELRSSMSKLRLNNLAVGSDGRNRCMLSPYRARTGRNQPSSTAFVFGLAVWLRFLIKPGPGMAIAYIDWSQQEFGVVAAFSGDKAMQQAYLSGDPYLAFAKQAGAVPQNATKKSHSIERELYKSCVLAVQYGMGDKGLAARIGQSALAARQLIQSHEETYKDFWEWLDRVLNHAMLFEELHTVFGWKVNVGNNSNKRMLMNFPAQANGAEILRLACMMATDHGIKICAPNHDAILIEAPLTEIDETVKITQEIMAEASSIVLSGFRLRSEAEIFKYPDHYFDPRGAEMWNKVMKILDETG